MERPIREIDKIIKEKLINYEEDPSPEFWSRLNSRLTRPRIISGILLFMVLAAGIIFWLMMPKLDAGIFSEQTLINDYQKSNNNSKHVYGQEIENTSYEEQKVYEKTNTPSYISNNDNTFTESKHTEVKKRVFKKDKKSDIVKSEPAIQTDVNK